MQRLTVKRLSNESEAFRRGYCDGIAGRVALFRKVGGDFVACCDDEASEYLSEGWNQQDRAEYMKGYETAES